VIDRQDQRVASSAWLPPFSCCGLLSSVRLAIFKPVVIFFLWFRDLFYLHFKERLDFRSRLCIVSSLLRLIEDYG